MNVVLEVEEARRETVTTQRRPSSANDNETPIRSQTSERSNHHVNGQQDTHERELWIDQQYSEETTRMNLLSHPRRQICAQGKPIVTKTIEEGLSSTIPCQFYLRTGTCGYGESCRYFHPPNIEPPELNTIGYPTREGVEKCRFYLRFGFCSFGATCRFDHPNPIPYHKKSAVFPQTFGTSYLSANSDVDLGSPTHSTSVYEPVFGTPIPTYGLYAQVLIPSMTYASVMAQQSAYPYGIPFSNFPYEYPPLSQDQDWPRYDITNVDSLQMESRTPVSSEETTEVYDDVTKELNEEEEEEDSECKAYMERCQSV